MKAWHGRHDRGATDHRQRRRAGRRGRPAGRRELLPPHPRAALRPAERPPVGPRRGESG
jgi:hypothetical protein